MKRNLLCLFAMLNMTIIIAQSWQQTKGPYASRATAMTTVGDNIYVANRDYGATDGSVYRSNNLGEDWILADEGIGTAYVLQFANIGETMLAAAANLFGVFRTTNQGTHWDMITGGIFAPALSVEAVGNDFWVGTEGGGVFKSTNLGLTFTPKNNGLGIGQVIVYDIEQLGPYLYVSVEGGGGPARLYRSVDNGESWQYSNTGLPLGTNPHKMAVNGNTIYVSCVGDFAQYEYGLYKSTDFGATWTPANNGIPVILNGNTGEVWVHDNIVYVSVTYPDTTPKIYKSTNDGVSFVPAANGLRNNNQQVYGYTAKDDFIFAGSGWYGSVFRSNDEGANWEEARRGLANATVYSLMEFGDRLYAGTQQGLFYTTDMGQHWTEMQNGLPFGLPITSMEQNGNAIYLATDQYGMYRSLDGGNTWSQANTGLDLTFAVWMEELHYSNGALYAATWDGIYKTTDNGNQWTLASNGLPTEFGGSLVSVNAISSHNGALFAGTDLEGIFKSTNNGASWTAVNTGLTFYAQTVRGFASIGNTLYAGTDAGVYTSIDNGAHWQIVPALSEGQWRTIYSEDGNIFASNYGATVLTGFAVMRSEDNGVTWTEIENGMRTNARVMAFEVQNGNLYGGTDTRSVWQWNETLSIKNHDQNRVTLLPNPTSGLVTIANLQNCETTIYNTLGREISVQSGNHINLSGQPSGIYLLHVKSDSGSIVKKVVKQ